MYYACYILDISGPKACNVYNEYYFNNLECTLFLPNNEIKLASWFLRSKTGTFTKPPTLLIINWPKACNVHNEHYMNNL